MKSIATIVAGLVPVLAAAAAVCLPMAGRWGG